MDNPTIHSLPSNIPDESDNNQRPDTVALLREVLLAGDGPAIETTIESNLLRFDGAFFELVSDLCQHASVSPEETQTTLRSLSWLIGKALFSHALEAYRESQLMMAIQYWNQAIPAYLVALSPRGVSDCLGNVGIAYQLLGEYSEALDYLQRALAIDTTEDDREGQVKRLNNMCGLYLEQGSVDEALNYSQRALSLASLIGDRRGESAALNNLALAHQDRGEFETARTMLQEARALDEADHDPRGLALRLGNLGRLHQLSGQHAVALVHYQQALTLCQELGDAWGEINQRNNIGLLHFLTGNIRFALAELNTVISRAQAIKYRLGEASAWNNLGLIYQLGGEIKTAVACQESALAAYQQMDNPQGQATALLNLGNLFLLSNEPDRSMHCYETALNVYRTIGYSEGEVKAIGNIGAVHHLKGDLNEASVAYRMALNLARTIGDKLGEAERLGSLGAILQQQGALSEAIDLQTQAISLVREIDQPDLTSRLLVSRGRSWSELSNLQAALADFQAAVVSAEGLREQFADESLRTRFFGQDKMYVFRQIVSLFAQLGDSVSALNYAERGRSRTFLDLLAWTELDFFPPVTLAEAKREVELNRSLRSITLAQHQSTTEPLRRALALQYSLVQEQLETTLESIGKISPEYVTLRKAVPISYEDIRRCLADIPRQIGSSR